MVTALQHPTQEQTAHLDFVESLRQIVLQETDGGRRIVRSVVSILEGNAPNCTPWHQLEAAKLLYKFGLGDAQALLGGIHKQDRKADPANNPSPSMVEDQPRHSCEACPGPRTGSRNPQGEEQGDPSCESCSSMPDELIKLNKKLVRQIRVETYEGASMVRYLIEIMEGDDPGTRGRDRIDAIKILLRLCCDNLAHPYLNCNSRFGFSRSSQAASTATDSF